MTTKPGPQLKTVLMGKIVRNDTRQESLKFRLPFAPVVRALLPPADMPGTAHRSDPRSASPTATGKTGHQGSKVEMGLSWLSFLSLME